MNQKTPSQIRLDEKLHEKVKIIADKELRSMNSQMEYFLIKGVEEYERINGEIRLNEHE